MPDLWMDVDANLSEVPVNIMPLLDDKDFKSREESVAYNAAGLELIWHFTKTDGSTTATVVTPTSSSTGDIPPGGNYDWAHQDGGMYTIEIPASGGASINNDTEGFGWFTGKADGVLPWRGPVIGFRAAGLNNLLIDDAYSTTRGLAGTALPAAAADAAGGLPVSDAGGLDVDAALGRITGNVALASVCTETRLAELDAANIPTDLSTIAGSVADVLTDTGTTLPGQIAALNNVSAAEVNAACDTAISDAALATAANLATVAGNVSSVLEDTGTTLPGTLATIDGKADSIKAKTDNLPASPAAVGSAMTLTAAYDPAKTAAQASVCTEARLAELDAANIPSDLATIAGGVADVLVDTGTDLPGQIAALNDLSSAEVNAACDTAIADAALATAANLATVDGVVDAIKAKTDNLPTAPAAQGDIPSAAAIRSEMEADGSKLDHLWETTEDDGGVRRFTANALELAPAGAGGGSATLENQELILTGLGDIKGTGFVKDTHSLTNLVPGSPVNISVASGVEQ